MMRSAMIDLEEIRSLSDFQRNAKQHIVRMKKKRRPLVLTINGKAEMVAVDVKSFQEMLEIIDRAEAVEGIRRGLESKKRGEGKTLEQFDREMRKKYKVSETLQNDL
jgi:PHD/YefM family antitoxin component YafN of YafNO toxin-antitoxin module